MQILGQARREAAEPAVASASHLLEVAFACVSLVRRYLSSAGSDRAARPGQSGQGARDPRAPPRAVNSPPPGRAAALRDARPSAAGGVQPDAPSPLLECVLCTAGDASSLASSTGSSALDVSAPSPRPAADQPGRTRTDPPPRA